MALFRKCPFVCTLQRHCRPSQQPSTSWPLPFCPLSFLTGYYIHDGDFDCMFHLSIYPSVRPSFRSSKLCSRHHWQQQSFCTNLVVSFNWGPQFTSESLCRDGFLKQFVCSTRWGLCSKTQSGNQWIPVPALPSRQQLVFANCLFVCWSTQESCSDTNLKIVHSWNLELWCNLRTNKFKD